MKPEQNVKKVDLEFGEVRALIVKLLEEEGKGTAKEKDVNKLLELIRIYILSSLDTVCLEIGKDYNTEAKVIDQNGDISPAWEKELRGALPGKFDTELVESILKATPAYILKVLKNNKNTVEREFFRLDVRDGEVIITITNLDLLGPAKNPDAVEDFDPEND